MTVRRRPVSRDSRRRCFLASSRVEPLTDVTRLLTGASAHGARRTDAGHRVGRVVAFPAGQLQVLVAAAAAAAAARGHAVFEGPLGAFVALFFGAFRLGVGLGGRAGAPAPAAAAAPTAAAGVLVLVAFFVLGLRCCGGNGDRTHHSAQVGGLEDHGSEGTRFHEQRRGRAFLGRASGSSGWASAASAAAAASPAAASSARERLPRLRLRLSGRPWHGWHGGGPASLQPSLRPLCGGGCVSGSCRGGLSRGRRVGFGLAGEGRQRFRGGYSFAGAGAPCGRLGLGCSSFGAAVRLPALAGSAATGSSEPAASARAAASATASAAAAASTLATGAFRRVRTALFGATGASASAVPLLPRRRLVLRYRLLPGHYPYVATLLPLMRRHIRRPLGQICVNTRRH